MRKFDSVRSFLRATLGAGAVAMTTRATLAQSSPRASPRAPAAPSAQSDEAAIRAMRTRSNAAIAAHDADGVARTLDADFVSVSSTNVRDVGREAARATYNQIFASRPGVIFVRTPSRITVNAKWRQAGESGRWTGRWTTPEGDVRVGGDYFAKWRERDGEWLMLAETFVLTSCEGTHYCDAPPTPTPSSPSPKRP